MGNQHVYEFATSLFKKGAINQLGQGHQQFDVLNLAAGNFILSFFDHL